MTGSHGAAPTEKVSTPAAAPIAWRVWVKSSPCAFVRIEAQSWDTARELGAIDLGVLTELADAEPWESTK